MLSAKTNTPDDGREAARGSSRITTSPVRPRQWRPATMPTDRTAGLDDDAVRA